MDDGREYLVIEDCGDYICLGWDDEDECFWDIDKDDLPAVIEQLLHYVRTN